MIKLVQLEKINGRIGFFCRAAAPTPPGCLQNDTLDVSALAETLLELHQQSGCRLKKSCLSLPGQMMTYRRVTLPLLSPPETEKIMRWEAEKQLPLPVGQYVFDYVFLGKRVLREKMVQEFVLAAAPRALAELCIEAAARAGFYPEAADAAPFALRRVIHWYGTNNPDPYRDTVLVINTGAERSDLLVLNQGCFRFHRSVNLGVNHFLRETSVNRPETTKNEYQPGPEDFSGRPTASDTALKLIRQAARTLEYYALVNDFRDSRCAAVILCGGGAMIADLVNNFTTESGFKTICFDPLTNVIENTVGNITEAEAGPLYVTAMGMALRGWIQ